MDHLQNRANSENECFECFVRIARDKNLYTFKGLMDFWKLQKNIIFLNRNYYKKNLRKAKKMYNFLGFLFLISYGKIDRQQN